MLVILSLLLAVTIIATFWSATKGKLSETIIGVVFIIMIGAMFGVYFYEQQERKKIPTAMDVYRGNTTLEITYRDSIPVDTTVVWKDKTFKK